ncbi:MAG: hypothetical protein H0T42_19945 [Deltaproteobacteria bacterium]|nr:hypothetical protein [Deltaproteobacteria bacterium]
MIVHLNGWPGVGKRTIGELLASLLGATFIHNHMLHDVAIVCAGLRAPERWPLYEIVRAAAYDGLAKRPFNDVFVMTNALCVVAAREVQAWEHVVELAMRRNVPLIPVVLHADIDELCRRVQHAGRAGRKLSDPGALRAMIARDNLQHPQVPETLMLDVTSASAEQAAAAIVDHVQIIRENLVAATTRHLQVESRLAAGRPS